MGMLIWQSGDPTNPQTLAPRLNAKTTRRLEWRLYGRIVADGNEKRADLTLPMLAHWCFQLMKSV